MTDSEYKNIQKELSNLMDIHKLVYKNITGKRLEGYLQAIKAAKSVLSNYSPYRMKEEKSE